MGRVDAQQRKTEREAPGAVGEMRHYFASIAPSYERLNYGDTTTFIRARQERALAWLDGLALPARARILDAGCGPGALSAALRARGFQPACLDLSRPMLERAATRLASAGPAPVALADVEQLPFADETFDAVCSLGVIEYLAADAAILAELHRVLRPGGFVIVSATNAWSPAGWLDGLVERAKRQPWLLASLNQRRARRGEPPILARRFPVRRHRPARLREACARAGFEGVESRFFHVMPWPHPFDSLFPRATARVATRLEPLAATRLGALGEGLLVLSRRRT